MLLKMMEIWNGSVKQLRGGLQLCESNDLKHRLLSLSERIKERDSYEKPSWDQYKCQRLASKTTPEKGPKSNWIKLWNSFIPWALSKIKEQSANNQSSLTDGCDSNRGRYLNKDQGKRESKKALMKSLLSLGDCAHVQGRIF